MWRLEYRYQPWRRALLLACLAGAWQSSPGFDLSQGGLITLDGFRTQGQGEGGRRWHLAGGRAVIRGAVYSLTDITLDLVDEEGRKVTIRSPACIYRKDSSIIESDSPIRVDSEGTVITGVGYDILMRESRMRIRDAVRMEADRTYAGSLYPGADQASGAGAADRDGAQDAPAQPSPADATGKVPNGGGEEQ